MPAETVADSSSAQTLVGLSLALKYVNANQERYRKMLAVSCQMARFRGSWRNQMVTKTKPTILAQPNTCVGSQSWGSPTSASATGIMKSPATNSAIKYVTSKRAVRQNAIMAGRMIFSGIVLLPQHRNLPHRRNSVAPHTANAALTTTATHDTDIAIAFPPTSTSQPCTILTRWPTATIAKMIAEIATYDFMIRPP